jgi:PAS domain S-box-containing protein
MGLAFMIGTRSIAELQAENEELRRHLQEAEETILAIRGGRVDAFVMRGPEGDHVYTLVGAEQPYRLLIENMQQGAATIRTDGAILYCNPRFADLVQVPHHKLAGASFLDFVAAQQVGRVAALLRAASTSIKQDEINLLRSDGSSVPVRISCNPLPLEGIEAVSILVTDLSEQAARRRAEQLAERLVRQHAVVAELAQVVTVQGVAQAVLSHGLAALAAAGGIVALLRSDGREFQVTASAGVSPEILEPLQRCALAEVSPARDAVRTGAAVVLTTSSERESRYPALAKTAGALVTLPLEIEGRMLGCLILAFDRDRAFDGEDLDFTEALAQQCALALERARLYDAERATRERLETEVIQRARAEEAARLGEERYRNFIYQSQEGIWRFESDEPIPIDLPEEEQIDRMFRQARLAECNDAMARMYGYDSAAQLAGVYMADLLKPDEPRNRETFRAFVRAGYRLIDAESIELDRLGQTRIILNNMIGIVEDGLLIRAWGTQRDVTERRQLERELAQRVEQLRDADRRKDEFLAILAHELRNPLAPIRNAVHVLKLLGPSEPAVTDARGMIDRQVAHMARLIDDLLDVSRISRDKILLRRENCDLAAIVRTTVDDYRGVLEATGLKVAVELPDEAVPVHGDRTRLAQALGNLLQNANKFTDSGGRVWVRLTVDRTAGRAIISIRDTGIGMDAAILPDVFEAFSQADRSLERTRGGLGLGLALVKGLVELHSGSVQAYSAGPGTGSEFTIQLPLASGLSESRQILTSKRKKLRRVLIVEDNRDAAESMRVLLSLHGHQVQVASNGLAALEAADSFHPEVVLCDIGLPGGLDGHEVARSLRLDPTQRNTLLIALTGFGQDDDQRRAREAGFDWYVVKPVDFEELQRVLEMLEPR